MDDFLLLLILDSVSGGAYRWAVNFVGFLITVGLFLAHPILGILGLIIWGICAAITARTDEADRRDRAARFEREGREHRERWEKIEAEQNAIDEAQRAEEEEWRRQYLEEEGEWRRRYSDEEWCKHHLTNLGSEPYYWLPEAQAAREKLSQWRAEKIREDWKRAHFEYYGVLSA